MTNILSVRGARAVAPYLPQLSVIRWVREHADRTLQQLHRPPQLACTVRGPGSDRRTYLRPSCATHAGLTAARSLARSRDTLLRRVSVGLHV